MPREYAASRDTPFHSTHTSGDSGENIAINFGISITEQSDDYFMTFFATRASFYACYASSRLMSLGEARAEPRSMINLKHRRQHISAIA